MMEAVRTYETSVNFNLATSQKTQNFKTFQVSFSALVCVTYLRISTAIYE
jgi:hypothetical protein